ncbi:MAG: HNH endonuclease [Nitratireductor sp.]
MARTVAEWIGRTDDSKPTDDCKERIVLRQNRCCALSGRKFRPGDVIEFDHITPLWLGGENRERNLQAVIGEAHKRKTSVEAGVRAKVKANTKKHLGLTSRKKSSLSHPRFKKRMDGTVIDRTTGEVVNARKAK